MRRTTVRACRSLGIFWVCSLAAGALHGQETTTGEKPQAARGFAVSAVSFFGVYYSTTLPQSGLSFSNSGLGADLGFGGSAQFALRHTGPRSSFSLVYAPSYTGRVKYSSWDSLNHSLSLTGSRQFGKWRLAPSLTASVFNYEGFLFSPTAFSNVASTAASSSDFSASLLGRTVQNAPLTAALSGASAGDSAAQALLYGQRVLNASATTSLSYLTSSRFTVTFTGGAGRYQSLHQQFTTPSRLMQSTTSVTAGAAISRALSPRTQFGINAHTSRSVTQTYDSYHTSLAASLGRTFGAHWVLEGHGGAGVTNRVRGSGPTQSTAPHPVAGGSIAYRWYTHTFLGAYDRTVNDMYGTGASTTLNSSVAWRWEQPGAGWTLYANLSWQQLEYSGRQNVSAWRTTAGWGRALSRRLSIVAEHAYLNYSGQLLTAFYSNSQSALRCSLVWRPPSVFGR